MSNAPQLIALLLLASSLHAAEPITNSIGIKLVPIAPGSFVMGQEGPTSDYFFTKHPEETKLADFDERPAHKVTISQAFHLGVTEVTVGQYRQFQPKHQKRAAEDEAVTEVSWNEATAFCAWLSKKEGRTYRLPTEAEWEYACRAGTTTLFSSGDALPAGSQKWFREDNWRPLFFPEGKAMPPEYRVINQAPSLHVAQTPANAWDLHDMHGNVAEWCLDWHGPYEAGEQTDPLDAAIATSVCFAAGRIRCSATCCARQIARRGFLTRAASRRAFAWCWVSCQKEKHCLQPMLR